MPARCGRAVRKHARLANNSAQISVWFIVKTSIDGPDLLKSVSTRKFSLLWGRDGQQNLGAEPTSQTAHRFDLANTAKPSV